MKDFAIGKVEDYIAQFPRETQKLLKQVRRIITTTASKADESISYGMPAYKYLGKPLVYFGGYKNHIGFYGASGTFFKMYEKELKGYQTSKGTIQLPLDKPLPIALLKRLVKDRMKENEAYKVKAKGRK